MRSVGWALFVGAVLFAALPLDAQYAVLAPMRLLWLTDGGRSVLLGLVGGGVAVLIGTNIIWNAAMDTVYQEAVEQAKEEYERRKR